MSTSPSAGVGELFSLSGRVAVVTGGARGIGAASAGMLAQAGADVVVIDLLPADATVSRIREMGRRARAWSLDLRDESQVNEAFDEIRREFGRLDVVHNNAGIALCRPAEEMTFDEWKLVTSIDLDAVFLVARAAGRIMIADGRGGSIVNTASMSGMIVNHPQEQVAYNAAKAGVIQLTRSLAAEWAKYDIRVNAVSPGYIETDMTPRTSDPEWMATWFAMSPIKRLGTAQEVAGAVLYLASDLASFTTGANLVVDGGYTCY